MSTGFMTSASQVASERQWVNRQLVLFYLILFAEVVFYLPIARMAYRVVAGWEDVGSNFLGMLLLVVLPGAVIFGLVVAWSYRKRARKGVGSYREFIRRIWFIDIGLFVGSLLIYYLSEAPSR